MSSLLDFHQIESQIHKLQLSKFHQNMRFVMNRSVCLLWFFQWNQSHRNQVLYFVLQINAMRRNIVSCFTTDKIIQIQPKEKLGQLIDWKGYQTIRLFYIRCLYIVLAKILKIFKLQDYHVKAKDIFIHTYLYVTLSKE